MRDREDPRFAARARVFSATSPYSPIARLVAVVLFDRMRELADGQYGCWPSVPTIRRDVGGDRRYVERPIGERPVQRALQELLGETGLPPVFIRDFPKQTLTLKGTIHNHRSPRYTLVRDPDAFTIVRRERSPRSAGFSGADRLTKSRAARSLEPPPSGTEVSTEPLETPEPPSVPSASSQPPVTAADIVEPHATTAGDVDEDARKRRLNEWKESQQQRFPMGRI